MKLSLKLTLAMSLLTLFSAISVTLGIYQLQRVNATTIELAREWMPSIMSASEMNTQFSRFRLNQMQHAMATESKDMAMFESRMDKAKELIEKQMAFYGSFPLEPNDKKVFEEFKSYYAEYMRIHEQMSHLSRQNKNEEAMVMLNGIARDRFLKASEALELLVDINVTGGLEYGDQSIKIYEDSSRILLVLLAMTLVAASLITWAIVRGTLRQLGKDPGVLMGIAERVTTGDYGIDDGSPRIGVYGRIIEMVGALRENIDNAVQAKEQAGLESARAVEAMRQAEEAGKSAQQKTAAMLTVAGKLEEVGAVLTTASQELAAEIHRAERGASDQALRATDTATAMEEMNGTVLEVSRSAGQASDLSISTRNKAEEGEQVVASTVSSIQEVQEQVLRLKNDMSMLNENAQAINNIMSVIADIADQTNLLALNAAIEAARAGEAGRGFAVVADEVRKLAEKTQTSTVDVERAIKAMQESTGQSIYQVDASVAIIEKATEFAKQSGSALAEIVNMVDNAADQVRAIATASEQQSATSEEINQAIAEVSNIAGETARSMNEATRAVGALSGQAQVLSGLIEEMKRS